MDRACTAAEFKRGQGASWGITKAGNGYLRQMLMVGAMAVIRYAQRNSARLPWLVQLMGRRPTKVAAIALATRPPERCGR